MRDVRTIILAAGKGTRMKSGLPKVLHKIGGQPIIDYVIDVAQSVGSLKIYAVLGHQMDLVKNHLPKDIISVKQKRLLGTADAVRCVEPHVKNYRGNVLILCGDTPLIHQNVVRDLVQKHVLTKAVCTFLTARVNQPRGYGRIIRDSKRNVIAIREDKDATELERDTDEINVGVYCCRSHELFQGLKEIELNAKKKEFYFTDIIELWVNKNFVVKAVLTEDPQEGLGVNDREDLATAESILNQRVLKKLMSQGITVVDPMTTRINANVKIGRDTVIQPFTVIEKDVRIGHHCVIGPFAHIRPGSRIGHHVQVGNFAEVSRTSIGDGTLMKHFGFLGDARVGSNVNIGAGVVTANYDGKNKNVTRIASKAFIGSDVIMVAPVVVGSNAIVGAGSVVTRGTVIPAGKVAVGVPAKIIAKRKV